MTDFTQLALRIGFLGNHLLPRDRWAEAPEAGRCYLANEAAEGVPAALGYHPEIGWYGIWTAGQGPGLGWMEHPENWERMFVHELSEGWKLEMK